MAEAMTDDYLRWLIGAWAWLSPSWLAVAILIGRLVAIAAGIWLGCLARPVTRGGFVLFAMVYDGLVVSAGLGIAMALGANGSQDRLLAVLAAAYPVAQFYFVASAVRRLRDMGWSPSWAWLLLVDGLLMPLTLLLSIAASADRDQDDAITDWRT